MFHTTNSTDSLPALCTLIHRDGKTLQHRDHSYFIFPSAHLRRGIVLLDAYVVLSQMGEPQCVCVCVSAQIINKQCLSWCRMSSQSWIQEQTPYLGKGNSGFIYWATLHFVVGLKSPRKSLPEHCWSNKAGQIYPSWGIGSILFHYK